MRIPLESGGGGGGEGLGWEARGNLTAGERTLSAMQVLGGFLYHVGGRTLFNPLPYTEKYDAARDQWEVSEKETHRQTDGQVGRQAGRQADRQTGRQTDRQTDG